MCGRFVSASTAADVAAYFEADAAEAPDLGHRYNVAPSREVYVIGARRDDDGILVRRLRALRWGLVPFWAKDPTIGNRMINARAEGLLQKPAFRRAFERRRCIVPADGFYEWRSVPGERRKRPCYIYRRDGEPLAFAGLWEHWVGPEGDELRTCTIVTTEANATVAPLHDRMPVLLAPAAWERWLDPELHDVDELAPLLVPAPEGLLTWYEVSPEVGDVRNEGPHLLRPVANGAHA